MRFHSEPDWTLTANIDGLTFPIWEQLYSATFGEWCRSVAYDEVVERIALGVRMRHVHLNAEC